LNSGGKLKGEMASSMVVSSIGTIIHYKRAADAGMPRPDITSNPSLHLRVALKGAARLDLRLDVPTALNYAAALQLKFVANLVYCACEQLPGEGVALVADTMRR
jgi:hypothetical protein